MALAFIRSHANLPSIASRASGMADYGRPPVHGLGWYRPSQRTDGLPAMGRARQELGGATDSRGTRLHSILVTG